MYLINKCNKSYLTTSKQFDLNDDVYEIKLKFDDMIITPKVNEKLIPLDKNDPVFLLLADISQRVHDFAISFFRSQKAKGFFQSRLDEIEGLGPKRKEALIKYFTTIDNVKNASIEELKKAGMPSNLAHKIYEYFKEENNEN